MHVSLVKKYANRAGALRCAFGLALFSQSELYLLVQILLKSFLSPRQLSDYLYRSDSSLIFVAKGPYTLYHSIGNWGNIKILGKSISYKTLATEAHTLLWEILVLPTKCSLCSLGLPKAVVTFPKHVSFFPFHNCIALHLKFSLRNPDLASLRLPWYCGDWVTRKRNILMHFTHEYSTAFKLT